jgi:hypothetical protein
MKITIETPSILDIRPGVRLSIQPNGVIVIEPEPHHDAVPIPVYNAIEEYTVPKDKSPKPRPEPIPTRRINLESWYGPTPALKEKIAPKPKSKPKAQREPEPVQSFPHVYTRSPASIVIEDKILTHFKTNPASHQWYTFSEILDSVFPDIIRREGGRASKEYSSISTAVKRLAAVNTLDVKKLGKGKGRSANAQYRLHKED